MQFVRGSARQEIENGLVCRGSNTGLRSSLHGRSGFGMLACFPNSYKPHTVTWVDDEVCAFAPFVFKPLWSGREMFFPDLSKYDHLVEYPAPVSGTGPWLPGLCMQFRQRSVRENKAPLAGNWIECREQDICRCSVVKVDWPWKLNGR